MGTTIFDGRCWLAILTSRLILSCLGYVQLCHTMSDRVGNPDACEYWQIRTIGLQYRNPEAEARAAIAAGNFQACALPDAPDTDRLPPAAEAAPVINQATIGSLTFMERSSLSDEQKATLEKGVKEGLEAPAWETAQNALENDVACLTGNGECPYGDARGLILVEASEADQEKARNVLITEVLPDWAERAGGDWAKRWSDSVGKVTGVKLETN